MSAFPPGLVGHPPKSSRSTPIWTALSRCLSRWGPFASTASSFGVDQHGIPGSQESLVGSRARGHVARDPEQVHGSAARCRLPQRPFCAFSPTFWVATRFAADATGMESCRLCPGRRLPATGVKRFCRSARTLLRSCRSTLTPVMTGKTVIREPYGTITPEGRTGGPK
jgi:hypothetical protein